ncbi:MAG: hypothetical protein ABIH34_02390 [Nanoarchaeota archaeon]
MADPNIKAVVEFVQQHPYHSIAAVYMLNMAYYSARAIHIQKKMKQILQHSSNEDSLNEQGIYQSNQLEGRVAGNIEDPGGQMNELADQVQTFHQKGWWTPLLYPIFKGLQKRYNHFRGNTGGLDVID